MIVNALLVVGPRRRNGDSHGSVVVQRPHEGLHFVLRQPLPSEHTESETHEGLHCGALRAPDAVDPLVGRRLILLDDLCPPLFWATLGRCPVATGDAVDQHLFEREARDASAAMPTPAAIVEVHCARSGLRIVEALVVVHVELVEGLHHRACGSGPAIRALLVANVTRQGGLEVRVRYIAGERLIELGLAFHIQALPIVTDCLLKRFQAQRCIPGAAVRQAPLEK
mmetsp:Transcript_67464/g.170178  ORF Transcript_67464/g.170178 Transcript_67464/m.170178 type:complete len:225 (-) Transcript_67464:464-1138(-)